MTWADLEIARRAFDTTRVAGFAVYPWDLNDAFSFQLFIAFTVEIPRNLK